MISGDQNFSLKFCEQEAFTLLELLTAVSLILVLTLLITPSLSGATKKADQAACAAKLKNIGMAFQTYAAEHEGEFPRSFHSGGTHGQPGWAASVAPYMGYSENQDWETSFNRLFRCPSDKNRDPFIYSYALNVHFELDPNGDDYTGAPATWRKSLLVPRPASTIMMGESRPVFFGDHFMCHQWSGLQAANNAVDYRRHNNKSHFLFVDGHLEALPIESTFDPSKSINRWNPSLAK